MRNRTIVHFVSIFVLPLFVALSHASDTLSSEIAFKQTLEKLAQTSEFQTRAFKEYRQFPFRRNPIELDGVIRTWDGHGSSIAYPEKGIVLISYNDEIIHRKIKSDHSTLDKTVPTDNSPMATLLNSVIHGDITALESAFDFEYSADDSTLVAKLTPRESEQKNSPENITISLGEYGLKEIDIIFGQKRSIKIVPTDTPASDAAFSEQERSLYFNQ